MNLTPVEIPDIIEGKSDDWKAITEQHILGKRRFFFVCECIFQHLPTEKYYRLTWDILEKDIPELKWHPTDIEGCKLIEVEPIIATIWIDRKEK